MGAAELTTGLCQQVLYDDCVGLDSRGPDGGHLVPDQELCDGTEVVLDLLGGVEGDQGPHLLGHLLSEPPVAVVVHLQELVQPRQILAAVVLFQQPQEVR